MGYQRGRAGGGAVLLLLALLVIGLVRPARPAARGVVAAWGDNFYGASTVPAGLTDVTAVAGGVYHSLALKSDGTVVVWGDNPDGQLNLPPGLTGVTAVAAGYLHSLALQSDGTVAAWGNNDYGQTTVPVGLTGVLAVAAGSYHSLALQGDGSVVAWGNDTFGQATVPVGLTGVIAVAAGAYYSLALKTDGTVVAWGDNFYGESDVPAGLTGVTAVAGGFAHGLALKSDGTVIAWGWNNAGQTAVPAGLSGVTAVAAGGYHGLALKSDGTMVAWGYNGYGQTTVPAGCTGVTAVAGGFHHSLAVLPGNTPPAAQADKTLTVDEDAAPTSLGITAPTDPDSDPLTVTVLAVPSPSRGTVRRANHSTLAVNDVLSAAELTSLQFQVVPDAYGAAGTFEYTVEDGQGGSAGQVLTLAITPINDAPVAGNNTYQTRKATRVDTPAPGLLQNDTDVDSTSLTAVLRRQPYHGTLTLQANGAFRYTPKVGFAGTDTFVYRAADGDLESADATVSITVSADPPDPDNNVRAAGVGTIPVPGGQGTFSFDACQSNGLLQGRLIYVDPVRARTVSGTRLTSIVGTGRSARIFGKGRLPDGTVVDFVVDLLDAAEPGRLKDTFRIELGSGPVSGGVLSAGNLRVNR